MAVPGDIVCDTRVHTNLPIERTVRLLVSVDFTRSERTSIMDEGHGVARCIIVAKAREKGTHVSYFDSSFELRNTVQNSVLAKFESTITPLGKLG